MQANVRKVVQDLLSRMADQDKAQLTVLLLGQPRNFRCLTIEAQSTTYSKMRVTLCPLLLSSCWCFADLMGSPRSSSMTRVQS